MPIIRSADVEFKPGIVEGYRRRVLVNPDAGAGAITLGEAIVSPGAELPPHTHRIEEAMVILEGVATCTLGEETYTLQKGDVILAPAAVKHKLGAKGDKPMRFVFFYPGVEVKLIPA